jgi:hypothetical protein
MMEFWPSGITAAGSNPRAVLDGLENYGFRLFEILPTGKICRLNSHSDLIERYPGRQYTNLLACNGERMPVEYRA